MSTNPTKLKVKIGDSEFEAEGPAEMVAEQFRFWKELVGAGPQPEHHSPVPQEDGKRKPRSADAPRHESTHAPRKESNSLFSVNEKEGIVTLRARPHGEQANENSVLLLLWGFKEQLGQDDVLVTKLVPALKKSGIAFSRVDRLLASAVERRFVLKGGRSKGGRYQLTETGVAHVQEVLKEMGK